ARARVRATLDLRVGGRTYRLRTSRSTVPKGGVRRLRIRLDAADRRRIARLSRSRKATLRATVVVRSGKTTRTRRTSTRLR
ncbi:hypothetical protein ACVU7I_12120, partial [Patulibacter sp. S7RM1-6]